MSSKDLLKELMSKTDLTVEKLSERTGVNGKSLTLFLEKDGKLEIEEYMSLGKYFGLSLETIATGVPVGYDRETVKKIQPSGLEIIEKFISKCEKVIIDAGLKSRIKELVPQAIYQGSGQDRRLIGFQGGVFLCDKEKYYHWNNVYLPYIDIKALIDLDDYELYSKLKNHPRTFGQMRYYLSQIGDDRGLRETEPKDRSSNDWLNVKPIPNLEFKDIFHLSDINFYKEVNVSDSSSALYEILETNKNYWGIINYLLEQGAYLVKGNLGDYWGDRMKENIIDRPATQMLKYIAKQNLK